MRKIAPYVRPYRWLVVATLVLTLIGSLIAQVNAVVLDRTVDAINALVVPEGFEWSKAAHILTIISVILLGKEFLAAIIRYAQNYYGERMRILVSKDLSQAVVDRILSYRMAFFSRSGNETGKLQTRIDQGVGSLSVTVQSVFIDLLPSMPSPPSNSKPPSMPSSATAPSSSSVTASAKLLIPTWFMPSRTDVWNNREVPTNSTRKVVSIKTLSMPLPVASTSTNSPTPSFHSPKFFYPTAIIPPAT